MPNRISLPVHLVYVVLDLFLNLSIFPLFDSLLSIATDLNLDFLYLLYPQLVLEISALTVFPDLDTPIPPHQPSLTLPSHLFFATDITMSGNDLFHSYTLQNMSITKSSVCRTFGDATVIGHDQLGSRDAQHR